MFTDVVVRHHTNDLCSLVADEQYLIWDPVDCATTHEQTLREKLSFTTLHFINFSWSCVSLQSM